MCSGSAERGSSQAAVSKTEGVLTASLFQVAAILVVAFFMLPLLSAQGIRSNSVPLSAEGQYQSGVELAQSGDSTNAEAHLRAAWVIKPTEPKYVQGLTVYYIHRHEFTKALEVLGDYVKRSGPTSLGWTLQGELLFEQHQYDLAYQSLRSALDMSDDNYRAHELLGLIFSALDRYALGLEELKTAAKQNPDSPQVHFYLGRLYYQTNFYSSARDEFIECLKLSPNYPEARENLGLAYEALGDSAGALAQYRQALSLEQKGTVPRSEYPYVCLGLLLEKEGQTTDAIALLKQGQERNPESSWANFELGRLLFKTNHGNSGESYLKHAATIDKDFSRVHFILGRLYRETHRPREAQTEFLLFQELDKNPENRQPRSSGPGRYYRASKVNADEQ